MARLAFQNMPTPPTDRRSCPVSATDYRELMSTFPTGVAVVTTADPERGPSGMTCTSLTSVTVSPPTLLVCLRAGSATASAVRRRGSFEVNLLHTRGRRAAAVFAGAVPDRFEQVPWRWSPTELPWLVRDAFALADCRVGGCADVGDHTVVLGEVVSVVTRRDLPLLYGLRRFADWDPAAVPEPDGPVRTDRAT